MRRADYYLGVAVVITAALLAIFAGWRRNDPQSDDTSRTSLHEPAGAADGLPEVVITARRIRPQTISLSEEDAVSAEGGAIIRGRHQ